MGNTSQMIQQIHEVVVEQMPPGGLRFLVVLVALTLVVGLWIVWSQRTLARNQVAIARMLQQHLAEHKKH